MNSLIEKKNHGALRLNRAMLCDIEHEINNPLMIQLGSLNLALMLTKDNPKAQECLTVVVDTFKRLADYVRELDAYVVDDRLNVNRDKLSDNLAAVKKLCNQAEDLENAIQEHLSETPIKEKL